VIERRRRGWALSLLAVAACSRAAPSQVPRDPNAVLVVALHPSEEEPTGIRLEVSNPGDSPVSFCRYQTPFEGVVDDIFEVRTPDGAELPFRGPILQAATCEPEDWYAVQPGRFHTAEVDLAEGYPVQAGQVYMVRYRGSTTSTLPPSDWLDLTLE